MKLLILFIILISALAGAEPPVPTADLGKNWSIQKISKPQKLTHLYQLSSAKTSSSINKLIIEQSSKIMPNSTSYFRYTYTHSFSGSISAPNSVVALSVRPDIEYFEVGIMDFNNSTSSNDFYTFITNIAKPLKKVDNKTLIPGSIFVKGLFSNQYYFKHKEFIISVNLMSNPNTETTLLFLNHFANAFVKSKS